MPSGAVGVALVATHDPDRTKSDRRVAADGCLVVRGRVDHEPVVALGVDQVACERGDGIPTCAAPVDDRIKEDVDRGVPVVGLLLLAVLHHSAHDLLDQHGEPDGRRVIERPLRGRVLVPPSHPHLRRGQNASQLDHVLGRDGHQHHPLAVQNHSLGHAGAWVG